MINNVSRDLNTQCKDMNRISCDVCKSAKFNLLEKISVIEKKYSLNAAVS